MLGVYLILGKCFYMGKDLYTINDGLDLILHHLNTFYMIDPAVRSHGNNAVHNRLRGDRPDVDYISGTAKSFHIDNLAIVRNCFYVQDASVLSNCLYRI